jgi:stage II sporulation protein P
MNYKSLKRKKLKFYKIDNLKKINNLKKISNSNKFYFSIFLIIVLFFILVVYPQKINANDGNYEDANNLYMDAVNLNMPAIKESNETGGSVLKDFFCNKLGLDIRNPIFIVRKELVYLKDNNKNIKKSQDENNDMPAKEVIAVNPFVIDDSDVTKLNNGKEKDSDLDIYDLHIEDDSVIINDSLPEKPQVLIYHTHNSEGYKPAAAQTSDNNYNVCIVGDIIKNQLRDKYKVNVIHDKTIHDKSYSMSYYRSRETLKGYLEKYGDFDLIIDLHRDGGFENKAMVTGNVDGKTVAKYMFVVTTGNPHYNKNKEVVDKMIKISNKLYPNFLRDTEIYDDYYKGTTYFNQDLSNNVIEFEVGADCNNIEEAKNSAVYLARIIAEYVATKEHIAQQSCAI